MSDDTESVDRPAGEGEKIVVTPEMIEAGAKVICARFDDVLAYGSETAKVVALEVFSEMARLC
jgi:hypothetical protein